MCDRTALNAVKGGMSKKGELQMRRCCGRFFHRVNAFRAVFDGVAGGALFFLFYKQFKGISCGGLTVREMPFLCVLQWPPHRPKPAITPKRRLR